ncbi:MAG: hypothetical protein AVDCRST_MAG29-4 [uncultured Nocardioidaceae bacterium]|uniref:Uncharacterized protein n=1 Tax=uncultured Nocardioidaceae bacterium TaxID=253824 RepID=A0A6J4KTY8_9ACTN|nr:MAG: hypothetical protein AVDCRST_MAG29-4 [uncultured Nocardioidaceae bacterium]
MVDVAAQEDHRRRRLPSLALGDLEHDAGDLAERLLERRPVLEVGALPDLLADIAPTSAPAALRDRLVPRLGMVQSDGHQVRQRATDDEVLAVASHLLVEPLHLGGVEHRPLAVSQDPGCPGVDHHEPDVAEPAGVAPSVRVRFGVGAQGEAVQQVTGVRAGLQAADRLPQLVGLPLLR